MDDELTYFFNAPTGQHKVVQNYTQYIKKDDRLAIQISSKSPELVIPFTKAVNITPTANGEGANAAATEQQASVEYLVDSSGYITFPILGRIYASTLTHKQLADKIEDLLIKGGYISDPTVSVELKNFKVTVLGEVKTPGVQKIDGNRLSIFEAIAGAGDLTIDGLRENVSIVREINGKREIAVVNLRDPEIFNSPYYYLATNDIVYVKPSGLQEWRSESGSLIVQYGLSATAFILSLFNLLDNN